MDAIAISAFVTNRTLEMHKTPPTHANRQTHKQWYYTDLPSHGLQQSDIGLLGGICHS